MDLKKPAIAFFACVVVFAPSTASAAASDQTAVMSVVRQYVDGFNKANLKEMTSTCEPSASLIDDFAPHLWTGANACANWFKDFTAWAKANRYTHNTVILSKPWQLMVDGNYAYVVVPVKYTWLQVGKPGQLSGSVYTLVLDRAKTGWLIAGWTWADGPG
jgi:SnoaL-like domain